MLIRKLKKSNDAQKKLYQDVQNHRRKVKNKELLIKEKQNKIYQNKNKEIRKRIKKEMEIFNR